MKVEVRSGFYVCGTRWSVYYVDRLGMEQLLASGFREEHEAKQLATTIERVYEAGKHGVDPMLDVWMTGNGWVVDREASEH